MAVVRAQLPRERGSLSSATLQALNGKLAELDRSVADSDPYGDDLQLALYLCYEPHYREYEGVDPDVAWQPELIRFRRQLEERFLRQLQVDVGPPKTVDEAIKPLLIETVPGSGTSHFLMREGELWQLHEVVVHRSLYHLKEADPQALAIPHFPQVAKSAFVAVQFDEYGGGKPEHMHAELFARMMSGLGLTTDYGYYLNYVPAPMICIVNFMSLIGMYRSLVGMAIGNFAHLEITSPPGSARMVQAMKRLDVPEHSDFYAEHVEADAVHEQVMRHGVIDASLAAQPELEPDIAFGIQATAFLDNALATHIVTAWKHGTTSLRQPLSADLR